MVAVPDFTLADGSPSPVGKHFAELVAVCILRHAKNIPIAKRESFISGFGSRGPTTADLDSQETRNKLSSVLQVDFVVVGAVDLSASTYTVHMSARRSSDGSSLIEQTVTMNRTPFTDSLSEPFPPPTDYKVFRATGPNGEVYKERMPTCIYCPQPSYNDLARSQKIQGTALFDILVSTAGRAVAVHPNKLLGYGLDEQAFNAILNWRFSPGVDTDGKPIAVAVRIEVTFQLY